MKRHVAFRFKATTRYHVVQASTIVGYAVIDTKTGRQIGQGAPTLLAATKLALALARPPPLPASSQTSSGVSARLAGQLPGR